MKLYLVQHGDTVAKEVDPERPLSDEGRRGAEQVGRFLAEAGVCIPFILHSGKKRAAQTAELLAAGAGAGVSPQMVSGIAPLDPVASFAQTVNRWTSDTMVVGHQPFMGKLVSLLVTGNDAAPVVAFRPGTVVCLESDPDGRWVVAWMIHPGLLTSLEGEHE